jgi:hypothetical protein
MKKRRAELLLAGVVAGHTARSIVGLLAAASTGFAADNSLTQKEKSDEWVLLFDGKTLNGWDSATPATPGRSGAPKQQKAVPPQKTVPRPGAAAQVGSNPRACSTPLGKAPVPQGASHWDVMNGTISPCGDPAGYLTSKENYKDFVLDVDFKTAVDTNSGVFIRAPEGTGGYEVQIWRAQPAGYNTGSIVGTARTENEYNFVSDRWNHYEITADGDHFTIVLNGVTTLDCHDSKFPEGRIRLQYQKFPIEFKNIKIRPIKHGNDLHSGVG